MANCVTCGHELPVTVSGPNDRCAYCGNADHDTLGYLAAEQERDARRAETCKRCDGYLKAVATLGPLSTEEIFIQDATTIELDAKCCGG